MSKGSSKRKNNSIIHPSIPYWLSSFVCAAFEELRIADIPAKVLIKKSVLRYQGVHLQASMYDFLKSLKTAMTVPEKESNFLLAKVEPL